MYLDVMMLLLFSRALFNNLGRYSTTQSFIDSSIIFLLSIIHSVFGIGLLAIGTPLLLLLN